MIDQLNLEPPRRFVALTTEKRQLQARLAEIENELRSIEEQVRDSLINMGDEDHPGTMRLDGMTLYLKQELWARPANGDRNATALALKAAGLDWLVKEDFNIQSLSAWVREVKGKGADASTEEMAQLNAIMEHLELSEGFKVAARKAGTKG